VNQNNSVVPSTIQSYHQLFV